DHPRAPPPFPTRRSSDLVERRLNDDRTYQHAGGSLTLHGRSLMLVRNVGHHMQSDAVTFEGAPIYETLLDACITLAIALHDVRRSEEHTSELQSRENLVC